MSTEKEQEAANIILPIQNTANTIAQHESMATPTTQVMAIPTLFGAHKSHFYTLAADGAKIYVALSSVPTGTIDPAAGLGSATGTPTAVGWPIPDGQKEEGFLIGGRPVGSGLIPTAYTENVYLLYRTGSGGSTGMLKVRRSSTNLNGGIEEFLPPGYERFGRQ